MTLGVMPFVAGVLIAPGVAVAVFTAVLVTRRSRRTIVVVSAFSALVAISSVTYWATWGAAFDALDAGREVPRSTEVAADVAIGMGATGGVLLLVLGTVLTVDGLRAGRFRQKTNPGRPGPNNRFTAPE
jgi:hypothetical protein